jgi:hypothetical protein
MRASVSGHLEGRDACESERPSRGTSASVRIRGGAAARRALIMHGRPAQATLTKLGESLNAVMSASVGDSRMT